MLNSCMDKGLEPTAVQWITVREAYKRAEAIEATMRARAEEVVVEDEEEDSAMEISSGEEATEP
jgi:chromosome segregation ATPase